MTRKLIREISAVIAPTVGELADSYATRILLITLNKKLADLYTLPANFTLSSEQQSLLDHLVSEIAAGRPVAQLEQETYFCDRYIKLTDKVLIPRPETEKLTEMFLAEIRQRPTAALNILEVGTGSGCITAAVVGSLLDAKQPFTYIASEISKDALECTVQNLRMHNPKISYFDEKALLKWDDGEVIIYYDTVLEIEPHPLQYVISNPPYLTSAEFEGLDRSVRNYEPKMALTDSADGVTVYKQIAKYLTHLGLSHALPKLFLEISPTISSDAQEIFSEIYGAHRIKLAEDQFGRVRYLLSTD